MKLRNSNLTRLVASATLGVGLMATAASCGDGKDPISMCVKNSFSCADKGVADGNFTISGFAAIDAFFHSVVNFGSVASGVSTDIKAELDGIQLDFGVSDADVKAAGSLSAAIDAKLKADFKAKIVVDAQPAKCEVDAEVTAQATVDCQASANCEVTPGMASVSCMGTCEVDVDASGMCSADAELHCEASGPSLTCMGECSGSCDVKLDVAAACMGTCNGMCTGTCSVMNTDGSCAGSCDGMCQGSCSVSGSAALDCKGSCNGSCTYKPAMAKCEGSAKASCNFMAKADAKCTGKCDGDFEPPKAKCDASASCEASAKADAKFSAKCTPPSIDIKVDVDASVTGDVKAQLDFAISDLKVRLPRLLAAIEHGNLVLSAGEKLASDGADAVKGTLDAVAGGDVDVAAAYKIGKCVPGQLTASANVITEKGKDLTANVKASGELLTVFGM